MQQREPLRALVLGVVVLALVVGAGCKRNPPAGEEPSGLPAREVTPEALERYPDEAWDDPQLRKEDRLQFTWRHPDEEEWTVWSMRLDGTDIRRVAKPDVLFTSGASSIRSVSVRSPDGRYLLFVSDGEDGLPARFLLDLRERKVKLVMAESGHPSVSWTPDSRYAFFQADSRVWQYDVTTGEPKEVGDFWSDGLALVDGGTRFLCFHNDTLVVRDRAGKEVQKFALPYEVDGPYAVSADGKLLLFSQRGPGAIVAGRSRPDQPLFRDEVSRGSVAFSPDAKTLFYTSRNEVRALDLASRSDRHVATFRRFAPGDLSLVPKRSTR